MGVIVGCNLFQKLNFGGRGLLYFFFPLRVVIKNEDFILRDLQYFVAIENFLEHSFKFKNKVILY